MFGQYASQSIVKSIKESYPKGTRVKLVHMDDPYSRLTPGSEGSVMSVDDIGTIHVAWDCGSSLGVVYGVDQIETV